MSATTNHSVSDRAATRQLDVEIALLREDLAVLIGELDRRRHEFLDLRMQIRRHARHVILTVVSLLGAASVVVAVRVEHARRRRSATARLGRLRQAVARMVDRPERVAAEPTIPGRLLTAMATAALATTTKKVLERGLHAMLDRRPLSETRPARREVSRRGVAQPGNGVAPTTEPDGRRLRRIVPS